MSLPWDTVMVAALAEELHFRLQGARVRGLHLDHRARDLLLFLREGVLAFRLHPLRGTVSLLPPQEAFPGVRPLAARIHSVRALPDDRVLVVELRRLRGPGERAVVVEWIPTRWNAVVTEGGERRIRHLLVPVKGGGRALAPGERYSPPPPRKREGADGSITRERWEALLGSAPPQEAAEAFLLRTVAWSSPLNAPALLGPGGWEFWRRMAAGEAPEPVVLETERGAVPYPLPLPGIPSSPAPSFLEAVERAAGAREGSGEGSGGVVLLPPLLLSALEREVKGAQRRAAALRRELEGTPDPVPLRATGDLLLARYHQLPKGAERAVLTGFSGEEVEVELDPALPPHGNAARYYDRAARAERALEGLPQRITAAEVRAARLEEGLERARGGEMGVEELEALVPDAAARGAAAPAGGPGGAPPTLPYRRYRSSGGLEIRVGRGARHNDQLTFHHAAPDDVWLHVRQSPGAHVVLRWPGPGNPPGRDLAEAAVLAAHHSEARHGANVAVDWTLRKYVRKPRKSAPGAVIPQQVRTLFVTPDPEVVKRLEEDPAGSG